MKEKGFTLIELLVVIGILAILATTVVLVLNPGEILKQSRDAQRLTDFKTIRGAIDLYLIRNISSPTSLNGLNSTSICESGDLGFPQWRISIPASSGIGPYQGRAAQPFITGSSTPILVGPFQSNNPRAIDGSGWVSVALTEVQGNSPLSRLPVDPINVIPPFVITTFSSLATGGTSPIAGAHFYAYQCQGLIYEINANMESVKYSTGGGNDVESTDGGVNARACINPSCSDSDAFPDGDFFIGQNIADLIYEVGNKPGLNF